MKNRFRPILPAGCVALLLAAAVTDAPAAGAAASGAATRWTLGTADTRLTLGIGADQSLYIYDLSGPDGWNWTAAASRSPCLVGSTWRCRVAPKWVYHDAVVDGHDGVKLTITFTNAEPAMELKSIWHARPGPGPVRHAMFIANKSGKPVTIYEQESLDVHVAGPAKRHQRLVHPERREHSRPHGRLP